MRFVHLRNESLSTLPAAVRRMALREARERLRRMVRYGGGLVFDALFRVDTRGIIPPRRLAAPGVDGVSYEGTSPLGFLRLLRRLAIDPGKFTFIDLGCGKGRTIILAIHSRFRRAIGVEISPDVLAVARRNVAVFSARRPDLATSVELVEADVAGYRFPTGEPTVVYLYNPFGRQTMRSVAANIDDALRKTTAPFFVVYYIPRFDDELDRLGSLRCLYRDGRRAIYASSAAEAVGRNGAHSEG